MVRRVLDDTYSRSMPPEQSLAALEKQHPLELGNPIVKAHYKLCDLFLQVWQDYL